jgi:hypothetical protein
MEERPKFHSSFKPDYMSRGPRIHIENSLDLDMDEIEPDGHDAIAALDPDDRKVIYYESTKVLGQLHRAIDEKKFYKSIESRSKIRPKVDRTAVSQLLKTALAIVLQTTRHIEWRRHLQEAKDIRNIYEGVVDDIRYEYAFRQTKPLNELEVVSGIILGASTKVVYQTTRDMKERFDRDLEHIMDRINGSSDDSDYPGDGNSLARSIACFVEAVERPSNIKSTAVLVSWKYFAASVCLRELAAEGLLVPVYTEPMFMSGFVHAVGF